MLGQKISSMDAKSRMRLDTRIKTFFIEEIRRECGEDFKLIENRIESFLTSDNLKDIKFLVRAEINMLKDKRH